MSEGEKEVEWGGAKMEANCGSRECHARSLVTGQEEGALGRSVSLGT